MSKTQTSEEKDKEKKEKPSLPAYDVDLLKKKGYTIGNALNSGSFSIVCKADKSGQAVAVKIIDLNKTSIEVKKRFLPRELYTMNKLKHPNIIKIFDIFTLQSVRIYVFMELADGGDLLDLVTQEGALPEPRAKSLYRGVADALRYIHETGLAHRDIKCENILLNKERTVGKIADFGFSRTCFEPSTGQRRLSNTYCGSATYAAPEILKLKPYDAMIADVWSMGVVLFVVVNNQLPFRDNRNNLKDLLKQALEKRYVLKESFSEELKDLIKRQLEPEIKKRITMKQVVQHKWLKQNWWTTDV